MRDNIETGLCEVFRELGKKGHVSKAEIAEAVGCALSHVDILRRQGVLHPIPHLKRPFRFDPGECIRVFCEPSKQVRSLTTEKRSSGGKPTNGGFRKCL